MEIFKAMLVFAIIGLSIDFVFDCINNFIVQGSKSTLVDDKEYNRTVVAISFCSSLLYYLS
jgi:hypothetical protein